MSEVKAIIFDVDGVLITNEGSDAGPWQMHLERDLGLHPETLQKAFFLPHWDDIVCGRTSIEERLTLVLKDIAPHLPTEELLTYWFKADAHAEQGLLDRIKQLNSHMDAGFHLATNQEHRRANYLWQTLGLNAHFDAIHYSADIGHAKPDDGFYATIENRLGLTGPEILFFDDQAKNIEAAKARGWQAHVWEGGETLEKASGLA